MVILQILGGSATGTLAAKLNSLIDTLNVTNNNVNGIITNQNTAWEGIVAARDNAYQANVNSGSANTQATNANTNAYNASVKADSIISTLNDLSSKITTINTNASKAAAISNNYIKGVMGRNIICNVFQSSYQSSQNCYMILFNPIITTMGSSVPVSSTDRRRYIFGLGTGMETGKHYGLGMISHTDGYRLYTYSGSSSISDTNVMANYFTMVTAGSVV